MCVCEREREREMEKEFLFSENRGGDSEECRGERQIKAERCGWKRDEDMGIYELGRCR